MNETTPTAPKVRITKNGPYIVSGNLTLGEEIIGADSAGESVQWEHGQKHTHEMQYALCRCGHSSHKPFCDSTHKKIGFDGTETANRAPYREQAKVMKGPTMTLTDVESLCASGRFCDPNGSVWKLVNETDNSAARAHFVRQTCDCPSGRLMAWDNATGEPIEPAYPPSIGLVEDPVNACLGPIWLRGGVQVVAADGFDYEVRNRMTLCRCGASNNKPSATARMFRLVSTTKRESAALIQTEGRWGRTNAETDKPSQSVASTPQRTFPRRRIPSSCRLELDRPAVPGPGR